MRVQGIGRGRWIDGAGMTLRAGIDPGLGGEGIERTRMSMFAYSRLLGLHDSNTCFGKARAVFVSC